MGEQLVKKWIEITQSQLDFIRKVAERERRSEKAQIEYYLDEHLREIKEQTPAGQKSK